MNPKAPDPSIGFIEPARPSDLVSIRRLLDIEQLPTEDITEESLELFLVCRDATGVAGVVGLERFGEVALLRSLVVTGEHMGRGLGKRLVAAAEALASDLGVHSIYLLTTTARTFFEHLGFRCIGREEGPLVIQSTREFATLCPASTVLWVKP
jgi:amino-acid N-acetyltransferase